MHILGLLDHASSGKYILDGADVSRLDRRKQAAIRNQRIGFVFQQFNLLPRMTVLDNVLLPTIYGKSRDGAVRATRLIEQVGLSNRIRHKSNQLSGGQIQNRRELGRCTRALGKGIRRAPLSECVLGKGSVAESGHLGVIGVLVNHVPAEALAEYAARRLEPVVLYDQANRTDLCHTLAVFLECEGNAVTASQRLFVHYNTLRHRLKRLEQLLGANLGSLAARTDLWTSVQISRLYPRRTDGSGGDACAGGGASH